MKVSVTRFVQLAALVAALAPSPSLADSVSGTVRWDGPEIHRKPIKMDADPKCAAIWEGKEVLSNVGLVGAEGGIQNAFVYVKNGAEIAGESAVPSEPVRLVQHGCWYQPRVSGIRANQTLSIVNDDPTLHNVRSLAKTNRPFNIGQPEGMPAREKTFPLPEMAVKFKCDVHPWMESYLFVMDHDLWAVTDADGKFTIDGLPPGRHTLVAWHEAFGEQELEVDVKGEGTADFTFTPE